MLIATTLPPARMAIAITSLLTRKVESWCKSSHHKISFGPTGLRLRWPFCRPGATLRAGLHCKPRAALAAKVRYRQGQCRGLKQCAEVERRADAPVAFGEVRHHGQ